MKKTIKEDNERFIMQSELLNDNTLLEYTADHGYMLVSVRYVDKSATSIKEQVLLRMNIVKFMKHQQEVLEINDDKTAIAIFLPMENGYVLKNIYHTDEHEFGMPDFLDVEYQKSFSKKPTEKQYKKTVTKED